MTTRGPSYVVGIDFGTTYSGIAWALDGCKESDEDVRVVSAWQDQRKRTYAKVPSVIAYDTNSRRVRWGYQVDLSTDGFRGIKLLLDGDQNVEYDPSFVGFKKAVRTVR